MHMRVPAKTTLSLRTQVALVVAVLSFLPNLVMILIVFIPRYEDLRNTSYAFWLPLIGWMIFVILLSAGTGYFLSRYLLSPLTQLTHDLTAMQRNTNQLTTARLNQNSSDPKEIVAVKASFNALLDQIHLEQARRRSFMATLVHDLKTPLIAVSHLLGMVRDSEVLSKSERIEIVSQLFKQNEGLISLVQKMVDAHKFERGDIKLNTSRTDLQDLLASVLESLEPLAKERGVVIEQKGEAFAQVDPKELTRALQNLIGNAVRYARSKIVIELYAGVIRISDDGPGLPAPLSDLAQPFNAQPVMIAGKRYTAGSAGLGLYISRRIIEAHGGRLVTEVTGESGTVLLVYLGPA